MSGHSKWSKIKHKKGAEDSRRGALFTRFAKMITIAAKEGGGDPKMNFQLRLAIEKAKNANLPKSNIERAIEKGTGGAGGENIEEMKYEGFTPQRGAIVIEALTDNKNRTSSTIKHILSKHGGNLGAPNSALWMFNRFGVLRIENRFLDNFEDLELELIEWGVEELKKEEEGLVVYTKPENLETVKGKIEEKGIELDDVGIELVPKEKVEIKDTSLIKRIEKMINELDESDEVDNYYTNLEL